MAEYLKKFDHLLFRMNGILYEKTVTNKESLEKLNDYDDIREDDVVVWTYPKSGTHAVLDIVWKIMFDGDLDKYASQSGELWFETNASELILAHNSATKFTGSLEELSAAKSPRVIATHVHYDLFPRKLKNGAAKIIYLSRHPKDVCVSRHEMVTKIFEKAGRGSLDWSETVERFLDGTNVVFGSWAEHLMDFYAVKDKQNILWIKYEDLISDFPSQIQRISNFLGRKLNEETINRIAESSNFESVKKQFPNSPFLRKGGAGGWKERFTVAQSERFDQQMKLKLGELASEILK